MGGSLLYSGLHFSYFLMMFIFNLKATEYAIHNALIYIREDAGQNKFTTIVYTSTSPYSA